MSSTPPSTIAAKTPLFHPASALIPLSEFDVSKIKYKKLNLTPILTNKHEEKLAFVVQNVLTPAECATLINISESSGAYTPAVINGVVEGQEFYVPDFRGGQRILVDDREFADQLFQRIQPYLPAVFDGEKIVEINERLRFLKYGQKGEKFSPHCDGSYVRPDGSARTLITLQIYLNEGFKGGNTTFLKRGSTKTVPVIPVTGSILVFEHRILHEGSVMKKGQKYTIRMDVLYTTNGRK